MRSSREISVSPLSNVEDERKSEEENEEKDVEVKRAPGQPTKEEYEEHLATGHVVYRPWCEYCVKGQAKADKHVKSGESECDVPVVSIDYAYMEEKGCERQEEQDDHGGRGASGRRK